MSKNRRSKREGVGAKTSTSPIALAQADVDNAFNQLAQHMQNLQAAVGKEREAVDTDKLNRPGRGAHNFDLPIMPLAELKNKIAETMEMLLYPWIDQVTQGTGSASAVVPQLVLPQLFRECVSSIQERDQQIKSILFPEGSKTDAALLQDHVCRNNKELFFLAPGEEHKQALNRILDNTRDFLRDQQCFADNQVDWIITKTGLDGVVHGYREIIVHAWLQQPSPATFRDDCGKEYLKVKDSWTTPFHKATSTGVVRRFDPKLHSDPVDCMGLRDGGLYMVVFPAMAVDGGPPGKSYTISVTERQSAPPRQPPGPDKKQQHHHESEHDDSFPVAELLARWNGTEEKMRTLGQLRTLVDAIRSLAFKTEQDVINAYQKLGITRQHVSSWANFVQVYERAPDHAKIIQL